MKYAVYISKETMKESIISDAVTTIILIGAIMFSHYMQTTLWTMASFILFAICFTTKLQTHSGKVIKFASKKEAIEWANGLPDDD